LSETYGVYSLSSLVGRRGQGEVGVGNDLDVVRSHLIGRAWRAAFSAPPAEKERIVPVFGIQIKNGGRFRTRR
jgi:hypothetical protein